MAKTVDRNAACMQRTQRGFTLIEVMISMVVLTLGLVSLLGVFGLAMSATQESQQDMIAKQLANESVEGIVTARDTAQLQWSSIQNTSDGGIFLNNFQNIRTPGGDGILGTADDSGAPMQTLIEPGPDGIYGTSDDVQLPLQNYQREIRILPVTDVNGNIVPTLRSITVTIQYSRPRMRSLKTYVLNSFISQYR